MRSINIKRSSDALSSKSSSMSRRSSMPSLTSFWSLKFAALISFSCPLRHPTSSRMRPSSRASSNASLPVRSRAVLSGTQPSGRAYYASAASAGVSEASSTYEPSATSSAPGESSNSYPASRTASPISSSSASPPSEETATSSFAGSALTSSTNPSRARARCRRSDSPVSAKPRTTSVMSGIVLPSVGFSLRGLFLGPYPHAQIAPAAPHPQFRIASYGRPVQEVQEVVRRVHGLTVEAHDQVPLPQSRPVGRAVRCDVLDLRTARGVVARLPALHHHPEVGPTYAALRHQSKDHAPESRRDRHGEAYPLGTADDGRVDPDDPPGSVR